jgi:hypothetical protein
MNRRPVLSGTLFSNLILILKPLGLPAHQAGAWGSQDLC